MTLTLLLDLDDTLLDNDIADFLPEYFRLLSEHLAPLVEPARLIDCLFYATRQMMANHRPDLTLQEVFDSHFYPGLGIERGRFEPYAQDFYDRVFPRLREKTRSRAEAREMVQRAVARRERLAVATNPLFPETAIEQRLLWADLGVPQASFQLVTSMETFHFAKPDPAYWAEVLAQLGWPEGPVVVVGDDFENDITAAQAVGLPAYWIRGDEAGQIPHRFSRAFETGRLAGLLTWADQTDDDSLLPRHETPKAMVACLAATPAALHTMSDTVREENWRIRPSEGEWSLTEILCHLRDVEREVNLPRLKNILGSSNPFLPAEDTDLWAERRRYRLQDGFQALVDFIQARRETLQLLRPLDPSDWSREARHSIFGPTDLLEIVQLMAGHDRLHVRQIHRLPL